VTNNAANDLGQWRCGQRLRRSHWNGRRRPGHHRLALRLRRGQRLTLGTGAANSFRINSGNILITPTVAANATTLGVAGSYIESATLRETLSS